LIITSIVAGLICSHFLSNIWATHSISSGDILAILFCLIGTIAFLRYARFGGRVRWILRYDEIRIERALPNRPPHVDTIVSGSVASMTIQDLNSEDGKAFSIKIRLRSGQLFTSPLINDEGQARSLEAEIARRLKVEGWEDRRQA
jgi:hypothetical protein